MKLLKVLRSNSGKAGTLVATVVGYVSAAAGAVTLMDKELVARTLGPLAMDWALLLSGVLGVFTGHALVRSRRQVRGLEADRERELERQRAKFKATGEC